MYVLFTVIVVGMIPSKVVPQTPFHESITPRINTNVPFYDPMGRPRGSVSNEGQFRQLREGTGANKQRIYESGRIFDRQGNSDGVIQDQKFYNREGQFQGTWKKGPNNSYQFIDREGRVKGSMRPGPDGTMRFYGRSGKYKGKVN